MKKTDLPIVMGDVDALPELIAAKPKDCLKVCGTCPWLSANQGKRHKAGWYSVKNLRRLWSGLRTGKAPGMVCHSTDPNSIHYGGDKTIKDGLTTRCGGFFLILAMHLNDLSKLSPLQYAILHPTGLTKRGIKYWLGEYLFGNIPDVEDRSSEIGLPWETPKEEPDERTDSVE